MEERRTPGSRHCEVARSVMIDRRLVGPLAQIAVVVKCWPPLSETFIAQEMAGLEARGFNLTIYSLRYRTDPTIHPAHARVRAPIVYLPQYLKDDTLRVVRAWWKVRRLPGFSVARQRFFHDLIR